MYQNGESRLRVLIAAGGTGGHVYPALAAAEAMVQQYPDTQFYFVGTVGGFERPLVERAGFPFVAYDEVQAGPIHGVNPLQMLVSTVKLLIGTVQALLLLERNRPQVILSTGGWVSVSVAMAARLRGVPILIFLPDVEPGLTIKVLRFFADKIALTVPESAQYFREGQTVVTGYPLRQKFLSATREAGQSFFGLEGDRKTLLVFGGSRGSRAVNMVIGNILAALLDDGIQVIHVTGTLDWQRTQEQVGELNNHPRYHAYDYLDEMGLAMAAADLVVCRSGASTLAEFPLFHLPSILLPLAYSWRYQQVNADYLADRGAAVHLPEAEASTQLLPLIRALLSDNERLEGMRACAAKLSQPDGARRMADVLAQLAQPN